jgi:transcriptional regulator of acetoin/glycerol metabolism
VVRSRVVARTAPDQSTAPTIGLSKLEASAKTASVLWVWPEPSPRVTVLDREKIILGRAEDCDVPLPGSETSRRHASISREGPLLIVRDLKSRNGVHKNGEAVEESASLTGGDVLRVGDWIGIVMGLSPEETASIATTFREVSEGFFAGPILDPILELARRAAPSDLPVVVEGETGTGKERLAHALHTWSKRKGPFVAVNCAALPESLAEAELFGYRKGAFTGAERSTPGFFRAADGGTLLLDEVLDLPLAVQAKLLRAVETREVIPLGESGAVRVDVRLLAASQRPLDRAVAEGRFRADLAARLDGLTLVLPPLRARLQEVVFIFRRLLSLHAGARPPRVEARLVEALCLYDWPLNVRELDLLVRRLLTLHSHEPPLRREHLPARLFRQPEAGGADEADAPDAESLQRALREHKGNVARAAGALGITRQRAYRMIEARREIDLTSLRANGSRTRS